MLHANLCLRSTVRYFIMSSFIKYNLHIFVISSRKFLPSEKNIKSFFTGLDEISSCLSAVQIVYL